jgi:hypothetical protein
MNNLDPDFRIEFGYKRRRTNDAKCVKYGETDPHYLVVHHVAGRVYGDWTATLCRDCHRVFEELKKCHPPQGEDPTQLQCQAHLLLGLADLFPEVADILTVNGRFGVVVDANC